MENTPNNDHKLTLDRTSHGIVYGKYTFMIDGYLDDYSLNSHESKSYLDLIDKKGYVDSKGRIWIYKPTKEEGKSLSPIPWFTVETKNGKPEYVFSQRYKRTDEQFQIDKIGSLTNERIFNTLTPNDVLYDEEVLNELNSSTSVFKPEIKESDDCLKRLIKEVILRKQVNVAKYAPLFPKKYILSNMKQGLANESKMAAGTFVQWAEMLGIKFHIIVEDNGKDTDPLKEILHYDNYTDKIKEIQGIHDVKLLRSEKKK